MSVPNGINGVVGVNEDRHGTGNTHAFYNVCVTAALNSMSPSTGRVTRGSLAVVAEISSLSSRERLIFAQAVYEYGARQSAWNEIAKLLAKHPLISKPKNFFTAQSCASIYSHLMKEAEIERYILIIISNTLYLIFSTLLL